MFLPQKADRVAGLEKQFHEILIELENYFLTITPLK